MEDKEKKEELKNVNDSNVVDKENVDEKTVNNNESNNHEELDNNNESNNQEKKDNRPFSEKVEDTVEDVFETIQDIIYLGPGDNPTEDIPATIRKPNGFRQINKVQTRRNINRLIFSKKVVKILLIVFGLGVAAFLFYEIVAKLLIG